MLKLQNGLLTILAVLFSGFAIYMWATGADRPKPIKPVVEFRTVYKVDTVGMKRLAADLVKMKSDSLAVYYSQYWKSKAKLRPKYLTDTMVIIDTETVCVPKSTLVESVIIDSSRGITEDSLRFELQSLADRNAELAFDNNLAYETIKDQESDVKQLAVTRAIAVTTTATTLAFLTLLFVSN